jgi:chromosome segregation ATPase
MPGVSDQAQQISDQAYRLAAYQLAQKTWILTNNYNTAEMQRVIQALAYSRAETLAGALERNDPENLEDPLLREIISRFTEALAEHLAGNQALSLYLSNFLQAIAPILQQDSQIQQSDEPKNTFIRHISDRLASGKTPEVAAQIFTQVEALINQHIDADKIPEAATSLQSFARHKHTTQALALKDEIQHLLALAAGSAAAQSPCNLFQINRSAFENGSEYFSPLKERLEILLAKLNSARRAPAQDDLDTILAQIHKYAFIIQHWKNRKLKAKDREQSEEALTPEEQAKKQAHLASFMAKARGDAFDIDRAYRARLRKLQADVHTVNADAHVGYVDHHAGRHSRASSVSSLASLQGANLAGGASDSDSHQGGHHTDDDTDSHQSLDDDHFNASDATPATEHPAHIEQLHQQLAAQADAMDALTEKFAVLNYTDTEEQQALREQLDEQAALLQKAEADHETDLEAQQDAYDKQVAALTPVLQQQDAMIKKLTQKLTTLQETHTDEKAALNARLQKQSKTLHELTRGLEAAHENGEEIGPLYTLLDAMTKKHKALQAAHKAKLQEPDKNQRVIDQLTQQLTELQLEYSELAESTAKEKKQQATAIEALTKALATTSHEHEDEQKALLKELAKLREGRQTARTKTRALSAQSKSKTVRIEELEKKLTDTGAASQDANAALQTHIQQLQQQLQQTKDEQAAAEEELLEPFQQIATDSEEAIKGLEARFAQQAEMITQLQAELAKVREQSKATSADAQAKTQQQLADATQTSKGHEAHAADLAEQIAELENALEKTIEESGQLVESFSEALDILEQQKGQLERKLADTASASQAKIVTLETHIRTLTAEHADATEQQAAALEALTKALVTTSHEHEDERKALRQQIARLKEAGTASHAEIAALRKKLATAQAGLQTTSTKSQSKTARIQALEQQLQAAIAEQAQQEKIYETIADDSLATIEMLEQQLTDAVQIGEHHQARAADSAAHTANLEKQGRQAAQAFKKKLSPLQEKISELEASIQELAQDHATLSAAASKEKKQLEQELADTGTASRAKIAVLEASIQTLTAEHANAIARQEDLQQQLADATQTSNGHEAHAGKLADQITTLQQNLEHVTANGTISHAQIAALQTHIQQLQQQLQQTQDEQAATERQSLELLDIITTDSEEAVKGLEARFAQQAEMTTQLQAELAKVREQLTATSTDAQAKTQQLDTLQAQYQALADQRSTLQAAHAELIQERDHYKTEHADIIALSKNSDAMLDQTRATHAQHIAKLEATIVELQEKLAQPSGSMIKDKAKVISLRKQVKGQQQIIEALEKEVDTLKTRAEEADNNAEAADTQLEVVLQQLKSSMPLEEARELLSKLQTERNNELAPIQQKREEICSALAKNLTHLAAATESLKAQHTQVHRFQRPSRTKHSPRNQGPSLPTTFLSESTAHAYPLGAIQENIAKLKAADTEMQAIQTNYAKRMTTLFDQRAQAPTTPVVSPRSSAASDHERTTPRLFGKSARMPHKKPAAAATTPITPGTSDAGNDQTTPTSIVGLLLPSNEPKSTHDPDCVSTRRALSFS